MAGNSGTVLVKRSPIYGIAQFFTCQTTSRTEASMPMYRTSETDSGYGAGRRSFRSITSDLRRPRNGNGNGNGHARQRPAPPEVTNAENFYYLKQMNSRTPMVIVMNDGERIHGCIEWYDRTSIKVNREGAPNLLIQKHWIKYLFKEDEL